MKQIKYLARANNPEELAKLYEHLTGKPMSPEGLQKLRDLVKKAGGMRIVKALGRWMDLAANPLYVETFREADR